MTQQELQNLINQLDQGTLKENATFGIFQYGGGTDESFIKADKEGLKTVALELLKAVEKIDTFNADDKDVIPFSYEERWMDENSDTVIHYIKPASKKIANEDQSQAKDRVVDKLVSIGCLFVFGITLVAAVIGVWTMIKWIF